MRIKRQNPEVVALKYLWPILVFISVWLQFPRASERHTVDDIYIYILLALIALVTLYRTRMALRRPNSRALRMMPIFDAVALAVLIRFTGGIHSDLWLLYYYVLVVGAMDTRPWAIELLAPLVITSYLAATIPDILHWRWPIVEAAGTRLFFLIITGMLTRHIAIARNRLSQELSHLSEQLSLSQERNRISREIHDGVGHSLVNCILTLELCGRLVCNKPDEACKIIDQEKNDLRSALDNMRDYVHHLRPAEIENEEFVTLVKRYADRFAERTGVTVNLQAKNSNIDIPPSNRLVLLRIVQEALTNAAKHSDATEINISLAPTGDHGVHCIITDNGCGFDDEAILKDSASRQGFGLRTMMDRASSAGGDVQIESEEGEGTRISVYMPG